MKINFTFEFNGKIVNLSEEEAKELYEKLHSMYGKKDPWRWPETTPKPPFDPPNPPMWYSTDSETRDTGRPAPDVFFSTSKTVEEYQSSLDKDTIL